jgi:CRP-like cAMP-binding protein
MASVIDRSLVRELPLFGVMAAPEIDAILERAASRRYAAGTAVFEQGDPADQFFVLLHGRLRVTQVTATGQQVAIRVVNPGDLFGIARALRRLD